MTWDVAEKVADAVLYEGYLLYPYRASSSKNQVRWQFGVLAPRDFSESDGSERWEMQTECLVEAEGTGTGAVDEVPRPEVTVDVRIRFLRLQHRRLEATDGAADAGGAYRTVDRLEADGEQILPWDEAVEEHLDIRDVSLATLAGSPLEMPLELPPGEEAEAVQDASGALLGRVVRKRWAIHGVVRLEAEPAGELVRLRIGIQNRTPLPEADSVGRDVALRYALLGAHTLLHVNGGAFVSLLDPPPTAASAAAACVNRHTWPVLIGEAGQRDVMLSSPIILYDYPEIAPESQGDLYDSTEIDEILTLRIMTLTDEEKREARATDPRARRIIDRADDIPPEIFERLHGAVRSIGLAGGGTGSDAAAEAERRASHTWKADPFGGEAGSDGLPLGVPGDPSAPYWEPNARVDPEILSVTIAGRKVAKGSEVILRPGPRGDTMDLFLRGKRARVEGVFESVDDETYVAVTVGDDPASEMHSWYGRYFYFRPTELEPADVAMDVAVESGG